MSALGEAASGAGPYYALPAWAQKLACTTAANCPRFIVLTDWNSEAVLDRETGLVWEKSPSTTDVRWHIARVECARRMTGGRQGWRLPSFAELASLLDPSNRAPALPSGHPFIGVQSGPLDVYWSATTSADNADSAWGVVFVGVGGVSTFRKLEQFKMWCVRGGMNADAY